MSLLKQKHLQDEEAAYAWVEARVWPNGPVCSHCGEKDRVGKMGGKATRKGLYKCYACRKQFNVKIDTIFESSHVPMHIWLQAFYLIAGSKKGISSNQLHRTLGVTLKTAWFMGHRVREAMRTGSLAVPGEPIGGKNKIVEADDSYVGGKAGNRAFRAPAPKKAVLSLVERKGEVRSFHVPAVSGENLGPIIEKNVKEASIMMTDEAKVFEPITKRLELTHKTVNHSANEYVRAKVWHTNTVENYFSILKRGIVGVYQHVSEQHLHRYLAEFDFRYNNRIARGVNDGTRAAKMVEGVVGKRLTYRTTAY
jgi:transposase-like protein